MLKAPVTLFRAVGSSVEWPNPPELPRTTLRLPAESRASSIGCAHIRGNSQTLFQINGHLASIGLLACTSGSDCLGHGNREGEQRDFSAALLAPKPRNQTRKK